MTITLTNPEIAMLTDLKVGLETVEDTFHRIMIPMVDKASDSRLQRLATAYRQLTPDLQIEVTELLRAWAVTKGV